ncbi:unnamed protein product [Brassica rapa subsp. trilocularis]
MGWVIKGVGDIIITQGNASRDYTGSALVAEALAVKMALAKAKALNLEILQIFSDSSVLISALRSELELVEIAGILHDIKSLATFFSPLSFNFSPRTSNVQADSLAKSAIVSFKNFEPLSVHS